MFESEVVSISATNNGMLEVLWFWDFHKITQQALPCAKGYVALRKISQLFVIKVVLRQHLTLGQLLVKRHGLDQLLVSANAQDFALFKHNDLVAVDHS